MIKKYRIGLLCVVTSGLYKGALGRIIRDKSPRLNGESDVVLYLTDQDTRIYGVRVIGVSEDECQYY
jgi:hypothetical protein